MYLQSSSPEVARLLDALGGDSKTTSSAAIVVRAGRPALVTLEQTLPSRLLNGTVDLEIDYRIIRKDYMDLLEPLIEKLTGSRTPMRSELEIAVQQVLELIEPQHETLSKKR